MSWSVPAIFCVCTCMGSQLPICDPVLSQHFRVNRPACFHSIMPIFAILLNTACAERKKLQLDHAPHHCHTGDKPDIGPILVVCYTNHALDSFLEDILHSGATESMVRVVGSHLQVHWSANVNEYDCFNYTSCTYTAPENAVLKQNIECLYSCIEESWFSCAPCFKLRHCLGKHIRQNI